MELAMEKYLENCQKPEGRSLEDIGIWVLKGVSWILKMWGSIHLGKNKVKLLAPFGTSGSMDNT